MMIFPPPPPQWLKTDPTKPWWYFRVFSRSWALPLLTKAAKGGRWRPWCLWSMDRGSPSAWGVTFSHKSCEWCYERSQGNPKNCQSLYCSFKSQVSVSSLYPYFGAYGLTAYIFLMVLTSLTPGAICLTMWTSLSPGGQKYRLYRSQIHFSAWFQNESRTQFFFQYPIFYFWIIHCLKLSPFLFEGIRNYYNIYQGKVIIIEYVWRCQHRFRIILDQCSCEPTNTSLLIVDSSSLSRVIWFLCLV